MHKLVKAQFIKYDESKNKYVKLPKKGFPRLLVKICCPDLLDLSEKANYEHYIATQTVPPPIRDWMQTLNNIKVSDIHDKQPKKIAFQRVIGNTIQIAPIVYGNNKNTLFAAAKRQMKIAPTPDPIVLKEFIKFAKKTLNKELGDYLKNFHYSYSQWYNHLPKKKQKLIDPVHEYYHDPNFYNNYSEKQIKDITSEVYQAICKAEIQEIDGKPRMVCSIPQKIKYIMGPITWALEEICAKFFNGYCGNKNLTQISEEINHFKDLGFTKVVEGDGSAFDNTQDVTLKAIDRYLYHQIKDKVYHVPKSDFIRNACAYYKQMRVKYQKENKQLDTYIDYYVLGTVFSGDCDTTLCNTLRMALYNRFINEKEGLVYNRDFVVMSKGDDFSVLYKQHIKDDFIRSIYAKYFLPPSQGPDTVTDVRSYGLGQICKFLTIGGLDSFSFCSLRSWFINNNDDIYLTRDPKKLYNLSQYSIKYKKYNLQQQLQYNADLALSYLINYPGIDVFTITACAHINEFNKINGYLQTTQINKNKIINKVIKNLQINNIKDCRVHMENDMFEPYNIFYDTTGRENYYKITDSYWETMKRMMMVNTKLLTPGEIRTINQQINSEFSIPELLLDMGINYNNIYNIVNQFLKDIRFNDPKIKLLYEQIYKC